MPAPAPVRPREPEAPAEPSSDAWARTLAAQEAEEAAQNAHMRALIEAAATGTGAHGAAALKRPRRVEPPLRPPPMPAAAPAPAPQLLDGGPGLLRDEGGIKGFMASLRKRQAA